MLSDERVAIVGMGGLFPGAANLDEFWQNISRAVDASREVPAGRWRVPPEHAYDQRLATPDRVNSLRGYFLAPFEPDLTGLAVDAALVRELDVLFQLCLHTGAQAYRDAVLASVDHSRIGVILGSIALPTDRVSDLAREIIHQKNTGNDSTHPLNRYVTGLPAILLADALGLGGKAYTLDAACASSLYALKLAVDELLSGRADAMLAGGLSRPDCLYTQIGFSQLRAVSVSGKCSPFDAAADGLVVGEGSAIFVLKRLGDAVRHGDRINGVIAGIGLSNDIDGNLLSPASEGQLRAMRSAYRFAGWRPSDVDLIECHATGTPVGDLVEFQSLKSLWEEENARVGSCVIGSVKSSVGHLLTGANAAGLMKILLSMRHEQLPPMANFHEPAAGIHLRDSSFQILERSSRWERRNERTPRRAAISGFGFGGVNAHMLIEEWLPGSITTSSIPRPNHNSAIAVVGLSAQIGKANNLQAMAPLLLGLESFPSEVPESHRVDALEVPLAAFAIPPKEMEEMLPQQLLMLKIAREALQSTTAQAAGDGVATAVFVGLGLDLNTTNFHFRWLAEEEFREDGPSTQSEAMNLASPPLNANRTMGALASITASRIARAFRLGGPSFTVSSAEISGLDALHVAVSLLRRGEIDRALVGAVDFASDPRAFSTTQRADNNRIHGDGAAAIVVKRLEDARADCDRIISIIPPDDERSVSETGSELSTRMLANHAPGYYGSAEGMLGIVRACLALEQKILPPRATALDQAKPQYWLHDSASGPRTAEIEIKGLLGRFQTLILQEVSETETFPAQHSIRRVLTPRSAIFLLSARSKKELIEQLDELKSLVSVEGSDKIDLAGWRWWQLSRARAIGEHRLAIVASSVHELKSAIQSRLDDIARNAESDNSGILTYPVAASIAFVYPGSGNHFADMGRELGLLFPSILDVQQRENRFLRSQYAADEFWSGPFAKEPSARTALFAQVSNGTFVTDLLRSFGIEPSAVIGYSLGESTGLFAMRLWSGRDEMLKRLQNSTLFESDLAAPFNSARACWGWSAEEHIDWVTFVLAVPSERVEAAIAPSQKAYVLIRNTPAECVIGGHRPDVELLLHRFQAPSWEIPNVTTAHCEATRPVRAEYRALHHLPVQPSATRFYSGASSSAYAVTSDSAADAILAAVLKPIDFPKLIEKAYADGIRSFIEIGPGGSCSRMIDVILKDKEHVARPVQTRHADWLTTLLALLSELHTAGVSVDLAPLYGHARYEVTRSTEKTIRVERGALPRRLNADPPIEYIREQQVDSIANANLTFAGLAETYTSIAQAHESFLRFSTTTQMRMAEAIALQTPLLQQMAQNGFSLAVNGDSFATPLPEVPPRSLTYEECKEFAAGSIANVLGPQFAEADTFPTRVRLPDGPLMLVDRILEIRGDPHSMSSGSVITEHQVHERRWYLDNGRIPTCIAVEAGQADLFLASYLGIDFITRGLAVYRLLDAAITFHRSLPRIGEIIRYEIHIDRFFRQADVHLFRFRFEGTVDGEPLLTMTDGCAGFFTAADLAGGKGIVHTDLDRRPMPGKMHADWQPLVAMSRESYTVEQIDSLREGDLVGAFGPLFEGLPLQDPMKLPGGMLRLVDRVVYLDPHGGRFGLGIIRSEAEIHPDDWFLTCHFVDDMVMPGTLMYECCMHTMRIFLMRMGWVGEEGEVVCEPMPGVTSRLKCRGQVISSSRQVWYEVSLKEIGYDPVPLAIADALMYVDGKPIVEITNMSLRMQGLDREKLVRLWSRTQQPDKPSNEQRRPLYDTDRILAFATGKPSDAFGEPYRIFDEGRVIARLPGPPYQFLDRITQIDAEPWQMKAGGSIEAEYDVHADAWYFGAQRTGQMPFSVLLEVALQPCGWLAAYIGSALSSSIDLSFRNLGGSATQWLSVSPEIGTLTTAVKITKVSSSGGMIIQHYDYAVRSQKGLVYSGTTYFGFFSKQSLVSQVGLRECSLYQPTEQELRSAWHGPYPREYPFPDAMLRMIDTIRWYLPHGGPKGLGAIEGRIAVEPQSWFFKAHFYQDPVWPGSLGLESFLQLLRFLGSRRWSIPANELASPALGQVHQWTYRGQVIPADREVTVQVIVTEVLDEKKQITADGLLSVDGRIIYQMTGFTLQG